MPEMSELYIFVLLRVTGKLLVAKTTNLAIDEYNDQLRELKVEELRSDGKVFKAWVCAVDDFQHELLDRNTLICSRKVKFEVRDPLPHSHNNYAHSIQVKIHEALMALKVQRKIVRHGDRISIDTVDTCISGDMRRGRWPRDSVDEALRY